MKKFCDCNHIWESELPAITAGIPCTHSTSTQVLTVRDNTLFHCQVCNTRHWYDADYENMMFDLKSMNN